MIQKAPEQRTHLIKPLLNLLDMFPQKLHAQQWWCLAWLEVVLQTVIRVGIFGDFSAPIEYY
jgi:hypothetical protein